MRAPAADLPIVFQQVRFAVRGATIIDDLTLNLNPGGPTVLIGPNGAGKITVLRLAMGLIAPTSGRVTWAGRSGVAPLKRAFVLQRPTMLRRSAIANVRYALAAAGVPRGQRAGRAAELLARVDLASVAHRPARRLSGGEQQRLALARALARNPDVLLLDEPTASLDPAATKAIEDLIRDVSARGVKVVMATHDLNEARRLAYDIVLLHRGRLIEHAPAEDFFRAPNTEEARRFVAGELLI